MKRGSLRLITVLIAAVAALATSRVAVSAFELSHYAPGLANADDFFLPPPELGQLIYAQYNMYHTTDTFRDSNGDKVDSVTVTGPRGRPITWFQLALIGYDTFQFTDDSGSAATDSTLDQVHAAGVQFGVPKFGLAIKCMHEYLARSRFEGQLVTLAFGLPLDLVFDKVAEAFR